MRITYLRLKNFAGIFAAMKKKDVQYPFNLMKNRIILLIGENGSGKTTILSTLHPFAYPGNMDVRNGSGIILSGEQGLKEIHFAKGGQEIKIKHIYTPTSTGHSLKSYISIDGEEKNPNGNVTSFTSMVETFLGIEQDYLKLTRLGANVVGLINMKATERKGFSSSLLTEVDVYTDFYKKINNDTRELKILLKSLSDKLVKLNISDREKEVDEINDMKDKLKRLLTEKENLSNNLSVLKYRMNDLETGTDSYDKLIKESYQTLSMIELKLKDIDHELNKIIITSDKDVIEKEFREVYEDKIITNEKINQLINFIDNNFKKKQEYEQQLIKMNDNASLDSLISAKEKIQNKIKAIENFPKRDISISKSDLLNLLSLSQEVDRILGNLSSYDETLTNNVYNMIIRGTNISNYIYGNVEKIDMQLAKVDRELISIGEVQKTETELTILYELTDDCDKCPYFKKVNDKTSNIVKDTAISLKSKKNVLTKTEGGISINKCS